MKSSILKSERFCMYCNCMRMFEYNRNICHSECCVCGNRLAKRETPKKQIEDNILKKKIIQLKEENATYKRKIKELNVVIDIQAKQIYKKTLKKWSAKK